MATTRPEALLRKFITAEREEIATTRSLLEAGNAEVAQLRAALATTEHAVSVTRHKLTALEASLAGHLAAWNPVHTLPLDLLGIIMHSVTERSRLPFDNGTPLSTVVVTTRALILTTVRLASVCNRWRSAAFAQRQLWRRVLLSASENSDRRASGSNLFREFKARADPLPLDMIIDCYPLKRAIVAIPTSVAEDIQHLGQYFGDCRSIIFRARNSLNCASARIIEHLQIKTPHLEHLCIEGEHGAPEPDAPHILPDAPKLLNLFWSDFRAHNVAETGSPNVTNIAIWDSVVSDNHVCQFAAQWPNLRSISCISTVDYYEEHTARFIALPSCDTGLEHLVELSATARSLPWFTRYSLTRLTQLHFFAPISTILHRALRPSQAARLTELSLAQVDSVRDDGRFSIIGIAYVAALEQMTSLQALRLNDALILPEFFDAWAEKDQTTFLPRLSKIVITESCGRAGCFSLHRFVSARLKAAKKCSGLPVPLQTVEVYPATKDLPEEHGDMEMSQTTIRRIKEMVADAQ